MSDELSFRLRRHIRQAINNLQSSDELIDLLCQLMEDVAALQVGGNVKAKTVQVQLGDLPSAVDSGVITFDTLPVNTPVLGGLLVLNADVDVGASGITSVLATLGGGGANLFTTLELVGETGSPKTLSAFTNETDFTKGPVMSPTLTGLIYQLVATGGNLDTLDAFDATFVVLYVDDQVDIP